MTNELVLLKLGGSLITDKDKPYTPRLDKLADLAQEIKTALDSNPGLLLILGHGSGSFGHVAAKKHGTREGVQTREQWLGFTEVRFQAAELNRYVVQSLLEAGLPAMPFPPSASMVSDRRKVTHHNVETIRRALDVNLLPVVQGDVAFDEALGGTILSTEDVFSFLSEQFSPARILLAGLEAGVWADFPARTKLVKQIQLSDYEAMRSGIKGSASTDVTGGMKAKVEEMLSLIQKNEGLTVQIFAAEEPGLLTRALQGKNVGTLLTA
ncbi:MAG TPA: isopentenyl phosphate kinase [Anaerolineales bacterium]|nr:isopentenyl phosphate kinase [Anaerolineales bacterium]HNA89839.1 isopentenyl phosphate kinase [Anaerolineales bacterium]HNC08949.1 isopentenyl phosphate kinase [Anaerolineales bacterium]